MFQEENKKYQKYMIEQYISRLVFQMPPNQPGLIIRYQLHSNRFNKKFQESQDFIELKIPAHNKLSFQNNIFFKRVFKLLSIEDIVQLYTAVLSEKKNILIVS
jgi:hypothetical protein